MCRWRGVGRIMKVEEVINGHGGWMEGLHEVIKDMESIKGWER